MQSSTNSRDLPRVDLRGQTISWRHKDQDHRFEVLELPEILVRWQLESKEKIYAAIERGDAIDFAPSHLPVVGTWNQGSLLPNLANKGVGFTPRDARLDHYLAELESAVEKIRDLPRSSLDETRQLRVDAARSLYSTPEDIDWRRLGLLEIFEGQTFQNLLAHPFASILWTGSSPTYLSFQVDCLVEIITEDDPRYRFSWAMRRLFEYERFHVVQTRFPYAYCFWVIGVHDKTPRSRCPHSGKTAPLSDSV